jgi:hypothetical protein
VVAPSAERAAIRPATVTITAIGNHCPTSLGGTSATMPNATPTPPSAKPSAPATRPLHNVRRSSGRASRGSRSRVQARQPTAVTDKPARPMMNGRRARWATAGIQISSNAIRVNT